MAIQYKPTKQKKEKPQKTPKAPKAEKAVKLGGAKAVNQGRRLRPWLSLTRS